MQGEVILISNDGGQSGEIYGISSIDLPEIIINPHYIVNTDGEAKPFQDQSLKNEKVNPDFRSTCYIWEVEPNSNGVVDFDSDAAKKIADFLKKDAEDFKIKQ
jgi:hypothetical protein